MQIFSAQSTLAEAYGQQHATFLTQPQQNEFMENSTLIYHHVQPMERLQIQKSYFLSELE